MIDFDNISYEDARLYKEALDDLLDSKGWEIVGAFAETRAKGIEAGLTSGGAVEYEDLGKFNFTRGQASEARLFVHYIGQMRNEIVEAMRKLQDEEEAAQEMNNG